MRVNIKNKKLFFNVMKSMIPNFNLQDFNGLTIDSRKIKPGDIFIPLKGEKDDGHAYLEQAYSHGASISLVEKTNNTKMSSINVRSTKIFLHDLAKKFREKLPYPFLGITGSNGKTTTKELLAHTLSDKMKVMKTEGNFNSTTGAPLSIFSFSSNADIAIIEMGANKPNEIEIICNVIQPNMGLITNIGSAHMEHFSSKNEIAKTKSALFSSLPKNGTAFVNIDDPFISKMNLTCNCISYSLNTSADHSGVWDEKTKKLILNDSSINLSKYPNTMNINGLAVYSIASELGMDIYSIISKINTFKLPKGRGQIEKINDYLIIDDTYNSNVESMASGIKTLIEYSTTNRKIIVIGDMLELGENKKKYHEDIAELLDDKKINAIFAFGKLSKHTIKNIYSSHIYKKFYNDKKLLINDLKKFINKNDVIYIKGSRSMKMEEIIMSLNK